MVEMSICVNTSYILSLSIATHPIHFPHLSVRTALVRYSSFFFSKIKHSGLRQLASSNQERHSTGVLIQGTSTDDDWFNLTPGIYREGTTHPHLHVRPITFTFKYRFVP